MKLYFSTQTLAMDMADEFGTGFAVLIEFIDGLYELTLTEM